MIVNGMTQGAAARRRGHRSVQTDSWLDLDHPTAVRESKHFPEEGSQNVDW